MRYLSPVLSLALLCACNKPAPAAVDNTAPPTAAAAPAAPVAAAAPAAPSAPADGTPNAGGLRWTSSAPLVQRTPKSSMRAAEYGIEGDDQAELSVFYFGEGQGGAVDANIARWLGQLAQPDGSDTAQKAKRSEVTAGAIKVSIVEAQGAYAGGMAMPGAPAPQPITDAMLLGAIANGPQGPVFFKLVGPRTSIVRAQGAFMKLVESLRAQ